MTIGDELARLNAQAECEDHILKLRQWLRNHTPREGWSKGQRQAYNDRMAALAGWIARSQLS